MSDFRLVNPSSEETPPNVDFGKPYGGAWGQLPDGSSVWAFRKGQRVRFYDKNGNQVGPEQANVAPAMAYAQSRGWVESIVESLLKESVEDGIAAFVAYMKKMTDEYFTANYKNLTPPTWEVTVGSKYARIVKNDAPGSSRSVHCFVGIQDGNIWKAAGWKAPALNFPRGNVNDPSSWDRYWGRMYSGGSSGEGRGR